MSVNDEDVKLINTKLDSIEKRVTAAEPSFIGLWLGRLKYPLIAGTWIFGAATHKWGLFHWIERMFLGD